MEKGKSKPIDELLQQLSLLKKEHDYEKKEYQKQTEATGILKKVRQGICWFPVSLGKEHYNALNQYTVEVNRKQDENVPAHYFEYGRPVCFFAQRYDGKIIYMPQTGTVNYAGDTRMTVMLPSPEAMVQFSRDGEIGVQLYFDETPYRGMYEAIETVAKAKGNRLAELREILIGNQPPTFRELYPVHMPWLNTTQEQAVNKVLCARDVAIVHGPPGTGKTTTLVEAIYATLHRETQVMVCAQSNMAVDWISEKLVDRGIEVLRVGNPSRVNDKMMSFTYERRFEAHPNYPELWAIRKEIRKLASTIKGRKATERDALHNKLSKLRERTTALEIGIHNYLFDHAHVIASTLVSSAHRILTGRHFHTLFIDEAAQALEASCWIAIRKTDRVIFAGDHCQLPPIVLCPEAERSGLGRTLMEKIASRKPECVSLLQMQYRMNEQIMGFSSEWFYHGKLKAAPSVKYRGILDFDTPICWIDTSEMNFSEQLPGENKGRINRQEADLLISELADYVQRIGVERIADEHIDFGIITPYKAQATYLRKQIRDHTLLHTLNEFISVNTVDGFQGQERDVVFISLVRSNEEGQIGFLNDLRRMNVAITRARMKLVILGDTQTLCKHPFYKRLMEYVEACHKK